MYTSLIVKINYAIYLYNVAIKHNQLNKTLIIIGNKI